MHFELHATDPHSRARAGRLITARGVIPTPVFMPVGTYGTVKAVHQWELRHIVNAPIILGNTYHLYLQPGTEVIEKAGGLHNLMGWQRPMLTDSGGFQVYSLAKMRKITPEGVWFRSHRDGSAHFFTPRRVLDIQRALGSDIMMPLDECTPYPCDRTYAERSLKLTHQWLDAAMAYWQATFDPARQTLFPIVQGSVYADLRQASAEFVRQYPAVGYAIGGLAVGEPPQLRNAMTEVVTENLPPHAARYMMGVGKPQDILDAIERGVDMFDCVIPTRNARHGLMYTMHGTVNFKNARWKDDFSPLTDDDEQYCPYDKQYSKAYLRHLVVNEEYLGMMIITVHNLCFFLELVRRARRHILAGDFVQWKRTLRDRLTKRVTR